VHVTPGNCCTSRREMYTWILLGCLFRVFEKRSTTGKKRQELFVRFLAPPRKNAATRGGRRYKAGRDQDMALVLTRVLEILSRSSRGNVVLKRAWDPAVTGRRKKTERDRREGG